MKDYLHLALRYFGFAGLWASERIKMRDCMFIVGVLIVASVLTTVIGIGYEVYLDWYINN